MVRKVDTEMLNALMEIAKILNDVLGSQYFVAGQLKELTERIAKIEDIAIQTTAQRE